MIFLLYKVLALYLCRIFLQAHGLNVPDFLEELSPQIERAAVKVLMGTVCGNVKEFVSLIFWEFAFAESVLCSVSNLLLIILL